MQIVSIVLYNQDGDTRTLHFRTGQVNIITGQSRTGKSAIIDIIDYCLGSPRFRIPEGIIKETVAWYSLLLQIRPGTQVFIAKPTPETGAATQGQAYYEIGAAITPPALHDLSLNSNDDEIRASLSRLIGITPNLNMPEEGQSRPSLEANLRHTTFYLYQDSGTVANRDLLFHRHLEPYMPQTIRDTLPFFLGVVEEHHLRIEHDLRLARRALRLAQRDLAEADFITADRLNRGMSLVAEAQQTGLLDPGLQLQTTDQTLDSLRSLVRWTPTATPTVEDERAPALRDEIHELRTALRNKNAQIEAAKSFLQDSQAYSSEGSQQLLRLRSIHLFDQDADTDHVCPLCNSALPSAPPDVSDILQSLNRLETDLNTVQNEYPRLEEHINNLTTERDEIRQQISAREFTLASVVAEQTAAEELQNTNVRAARVVGRVSLYLDTLDLLDEGSRLRKAVEDTQATVDRLQASVAEKDADTEERQTAILNRISSQMTQWARQLQVEHSEWPFRLDLRHLTVAVDRPGRTIPMQRIGGGANWLGCHLITLLSLHRLFMEDDRPVPRFLILDQPTQVYFVSPMQYSSLDGTTQGTIESSADLNAVQRMFGLLFDFCRDAAPAFQVIVLEHANLPQDDYQEALLEPPWTGDRALIPPHWPRR